MIYNINLFNKNIIIEKLPNGKFRMPEEVKSYFCFKTCGLKPSHEPITVFQKPLEGTYIQNIQKWGMGGFNIDACRIPFQNEQDLNTTKAKCNFTENAKSIGFGTKDTIYGEGNTPLEQAKECVKESGRFPPNMMLNEGMAQELDQQTGISKSSGGRSNNGFRENQNIYGSGEDNIQQINPGYGDIGGGSRIFPIIKYCPKVSPSERLLPDGTRISHVTMKPVELIKWLIKLVNPKGSITIDICAGSCTHGLAVELLNKDEGYNLKWLDIELMNTEKEPYCNEGKERIINIK